jgi:hypothetical protein
VISVKPAVHVAAHARLQVDEALLSEGLDDRAGTGVERHHPAVASP